MYRLYEAGEDENEECDKSGRDTVDAQRLYDKNLNKGQIKRYEDADERKPLKNAAEQLVKDGDFQSGDDENERVENDAVFGERNAKDVRIPARSDNITAGEIIDIANKRRVVRFVLSEIYGIGESAKGEDQYEYDTDALHSD